MLLDKVHVYLKIMNKIMFLRVYNTRSTDITSEIISLKTQQIKPDHRLKAHVLWSQQASSQNQRPRPESHVETLSKQTALACILSMCTHSQRWFIKDWVGFKQELYMWTYSLMKAPPVDPQYSYMSAMCYWQYIQKYFVKEISGVSNCPQGASLASNYDSRFPECPSTL